MRKASVCAMAGLLLAAYLAPLVAQAQVTADDFLPVAQGGSKEVKEPAKVEVRKDVVTAATMQDGINAGIKDTENKARPGVAIEWTRTIETPSGTGYVATGMSIYRVMENPTASRIAKRNAYVVAFVQAKKNLAEFLDGLTDEGKDKIRQSLVNITLPKEEMTNLSNRTQESLKQAVKSLIRGFVIYEVEDVTENKTVYVSIVTTPKTRGKMSRPAPSQVDAGTLRDGLNQVIVEVRSGLVPPVGGRIITVPTTGETAFVGFGSAVVRESKNAAVQAKLNLTAQKIADARALDGLCGLIVGDEIIWEGRSKEFTKDETQEFESATEGDPLAAKDPAAAKKLEKDRQSFVSRMESSDDYRSARKGIIPPGVNHRTWFDEDKAFCYGMAVYVPSTANAAAKAAREMRGGDIVQPTSRGGDKDGNPSSGFLDENDKVQRPGKEVKPGPSGKIKPE
jgi:hypothetical protein